MKRIEGHASSVVAAPVDRSFALLAAVHRYPDWHGQVIRAEDVLDWDRDGRPARARAMIHVAQSPFGRDFEFVVAVRAEPTAAVHLTRLPNADSDPERLEISWRLHVGAGTRIEVEFHATVSRLPSFLPLFGVGDLIAETLLDPASAELNSAGA